MANIEKFVISDKSSVRVSYFSISFGNFNLTPIPPKYIKSVNVDRYENDNAGKFEIDLVMPLATFESNSVSDKTNFTTVLSTMIASTQTANEEEAKMTFLYGWQNGAQVIVKDATISEFEYGISLDAGSNELISYKIGGVAAKVTNRLFEKHFYNISQADVINKTLDTLSLIVDSKESSKATNSIKPKVDTNNERPANYYNIYSYTDTASGSYSTSNVLDTNTDLMPDSQSYIVTDPSTGEQSGIYIVGVGDNPYDYAGVSGNTSDTPVITPGVYDPNADVGSNTPNDDLEEDTAYTEYQRSLFMALYGQSFQVSQFVEELAKYLYGDIYPHIEVEHIDKVYDANTEFDKIYEIITNIKNVDTSYTTLKEMLNKLVSLCYVEAQNLYENNNKYYSLSEELKAKGLSGIDLQNGLFSIVAASDTGLLLQSETGVVFSVGLYEGEVINPGIDNLYYEIKFDSSYNGGTIWIGVNNVKDVQPKTYIISNNYKTSDVISFSVGSNGIPGYAAIMKILNTSNAGVEAASGLTFVTKTDTGGKVPLDRAQARDMSKAFLSKVAQDISTDTSEATLVLFGSNDTINVTLGKTVIRVMPLLNNGRTLWCGDYIVKEIHDTVNENGFITTFKLMFDKSLFYNELFDAYGETTDINTEDDYSTGDYSVDADSYYYDSNNAGDNQQVPIVSSNAIDNVARTSVAGSGVAYDAGAMGNFWWQLGHALGWY